MIAVARTNAKVPRCEGALVRRRVGPSKFCAGQEKSVYISNVQKKEITLFFNNLDFKNLSDFL